MKTLKNIIGLTSLSFLGMALFILFVSSDDKFFSNFYPSSVKSIKPDIALELISNPDVLILDVREQDEYEVSHIANAFRYDKRMLNVIPKDQPILLYCTVGYRSAMKADELLGKGFKNVVNLDGGIINWKNVNQKVQSISGEETDDVHVFNNFYGLWLKKWNGRPMNKELLIIFVRNPELGKVKTRLAKTVGNEVALAVYYQLLYHTRNVTKNLQVDKVVFYNDKIEQSDLWDGPQFVKALQKGTDLGEKMKNAFKSAFDKGYERVAIIGSDCMDLTPSIVEEAFTSLKSKNAVVGAAEDGGYYLLGMSQYSPELFENKAWSTDEVFISTLEDLAKLKLTYHELPVLKDVDTEKDLGSWAKTFNTDYLAN